MSKHDFETPAPKQWDGPSGIARDSVWLTQEDIPHDRDTVLTIERVNRRDEVKFQGTGKAKPVVLSLQFKGVRRELGLNATNRKALARLFGSKCAGWVGKRIALFVQQGVSSPQGEVPAVRIRAKELPQETATAPVDNPMLTDSPKREPGDEPPRLTQDEIRGMS